MNSRQWVVAIVDDDPYLLESLGDLLESAGHKVRPYDTALSLLQGDRLSEVDCLITDIGMPVMDGVELQRRVNARLPNLPVIFITGRQELATQRRVTEASVSRVFQKPFDTRALLDAVSDALLARD
ncbi:response regulator [Mesorhizobium sp. BR1-1-3]|uniref:response regulator transcription factor n=1 Tax=Mesorhizobium sp. BR1-1-3 TaxID=2876651 RepID=UPI001CD0EC96|nr:response regulator [Mesorhizobium sp. BR1-1-3]MBZ9891497.1 response regulator [Mesorhizobium sp. BR1-1-3]